MKTTFDELMAKGHGPAWLRVGHSQLGQKEIPGPENNPQILVYQSVTKGGPSSDETAWCSSAVCWCLDQCGEEHTASQAAISYETYGMVSSLILGAIVVLNFNAFPAVSGSKSRHVGFLAGRTDAKRIVLLGGNQGNAFSLKTYEAKFITAVRWPKLPILGDLGTAGTR